MLAVFQNELDPGVGVGAQAPHRVEIHEQGLRRPNELAAGQLRFQLVKSDRKSVV